MRSTDGLFASLDKAGTRYLVIGGLAVVLHGAPRFTTDVDLILDLSPEEAGQGIRALTAFGLLPRAPVDARNFANPSIRRTWQREKHMQVFSLFDPEDPLCLIDLSLDEPRPFAELWQRSVEFKVRGALVRTLGIEDLIELKHASGRAQDLADIEELTRLRRRVRPANGPEDATARAEWLEQAQETAFAAGSFASAVERRAREQAGDWTFLRGLPDPSSGDPA
ncbi:MAG: hypothetical protein ABI609_05565 [Acidobacteriota bacterium]